MYVFFAISGYLIATSWSLDARLFAFLAKRCLRLFPALVLTVLTTVFVIGPLATRLSLADYFTSTTTWIYLTSVSLVPQYTLPGVFDSGHHSGAVNGSLWTLGLEFLCYLAVAVIGILLGQRSTWGLLAFACATATLALLPEDVVGSWAHTFGKTAIYFTIGALISRLPSTLRPRVAVAMIAVAAWLGLAVIIPGAAALLAYLVVPYAVIALGTQSTPIIRRAGRYGDISYGLYLWGYPVQQLVLARWGVLPAGLNILIVVTATSALAFASWYLVEKRALALKPRPPGPGRAQAEGVSTAPPKRRLRRA